MSHRKAKLIAGLAAALVSPKLYGQTFQWTNPAGGLFHVGTNWNNGSPALPPAALNPANWGLRDDGTLVLFITSTYAVASVVGFGWVLALLGFCQAFPERRGWARAYLACILLMQIYRIPWRGLLPSTVTAGF